MRVLTLLVLIWVPFVFVVWKFRRGWSAWSDFFQVFLAGVLMGTTYLIIDVDYERAVGLALCAGIATASGLWAFGPGTLPASPAFLATWDLFSDTRERWQQGKLVCIATMYMSLGSAFLWVFEWLSDVLRIALTGLSVALAITSLLVWRRTVRSASRSSS